MKNSYRKLVIALIALASLTLACNAFGAATEASTEAAALPPTPTLFIPGAPTATTQPPTIAPPTLTTAPGLPTNTPPCVFSYAFISDVTIPDDTELTTGQAFTKTWRIQNNGCQKWPAGMVLFFKDGDQMGGPATVSVPETASGGVQDISVNLTAPATPGSYQGNWMLKTPDGIVIGATPIYVKIKAVAPAVTNTPVPPTATTGPLIVVDFTATYVGGVWSCASGPLTLYNYTAIVKNTGGVTLESAYTEVQQPVGTKKNGGTSDTPFQTSPSNANCNHPSLLGDTLAVNATGWVGEFTASAPLTGGTPARLILKLCSDESAGGVCKTVNIDFTP